MTLGEALVSETRTLEAHRVASPRLTAEVLLAYATHSDRTFLYSHSGDPLAEDVLQIYRAFVYRRLSGEPLQYITGVQEFFGRTFQVNPSVLIPRPETERLVETVLELNRWTHPRIIDIGTGSGCVAITLSLEIKQARVAASDVSLEAVRTARQNAIGLNAAVLFACVDALTGWSGPFEVIVSNPPYVEPTERDALQREVRDFEPASALFARPNTADLYRRLFAQAAARLVPGGIIAVEIGYSMEAAVQALLGTPWELLPTRNDLQGIPRVVAARKS